MNLQKFFFLLCNILIKVCFLIFSMSSLYMLYSIFFTNSLLFVVLVLTVLIIFYYLKDFLMKYINKIISKFDGMSKAKMILIFLVLYVVVYSIYRFNLVTDFSAYSDSKVYVDFANKIFTNNGNQIVSSYTHVIFMGIYLSFSLLIGSNYQILLLFAFLVGTVFYFLIGCELFGKNQSFLLILIYLLLPSTILFPMLIIHEIFVYTFISISFYFYIKLIKEIKFYNLIIFLFSLVLLSFISPTSIIVIIALILVTCISKCKINIKSALLLSIVSVLLFSNLSTPIILTGITKQKIDSGSPIACNINIGLNQKYFGHFNSDDAKKVKDLTNNRLKQGLSTNQNDICLELAKEKVYDLMQNPGSIINLVVGKLYKTWRGPFHPLEVGAAVDREFNNGNNQLVYWGLTAISELLYLMVCLFGFFSVNIKKSISEEFGLIQCLLLGVVASLLIVETMNKYSLHQTIIIFICSFYWLFCNDSMKKL